ncbi:MAG: hypothetical protein LUC49_01205 [Prevotella sp.]|nr:hypothetical protein [Prevotella sp.]
MNNLFNFKWLMATMLLCLPMFAWGDELEDITLSLDASLTGWGDNFSYDSETHVATFPGSYCGVNLYDEETTGADYSDYAGVKVVFKTKETYEITLDVNYQNSNYSSATITGSGDESEEQEIYVAFNSNYGNVIQIYLMCGGYYAENSETGEWEDATGETSIELVSATVLVNAPETPESVSTEVDLSTLQTSEWTSTDDDGETIHSGSITFDSENNAELTFTKSWGALGWTYWLWDLSDYDAIEVTYENLSGTAISIYVQEGTGSWTGETSASASDESGTITFLFSDHTSLDYTSIVNILIECGDVTESASVTITSMSFIKYTSSEGEGDDGTGTTAVSPIIVATGHDYLNTEWSETNLDDDSTTTMTTGSNGQSATIEITDENGGSIAWKYEGDNQLDLAADYTGITVTYSFDSNEDDEQTEDGTGEGTDDDDQTDEPSGTADEPDGETEGAEDAASITLVITDSDNNTAEITGSYGSLSFNFSDEDYSSVDFSKVTQIEIKADGACTLNASIELVLWLGDTSIESTNYIITKTTTEDGSTTTNYYLNLGVGIEIWSGSETETSGSLDNSAAAAVFPVTDDDITEGDNIIGAKINFKGYWCGVAWKYDNLVDISTINTTSLYQLVVTYKVTPKNENETPKILLSLYDNTNSDPLAVHGAEATGTITCVFSSYEDEEIDFANIKEMVIQASTPCEVVIVSAELIRETSGGVLDQWLLLSQFTLWDTSGNSYTVNDDGETYTLQLNYLWAGGYWNFDDANEDSFFGVKVTLSSATAGCKLRLSIHYGEDQYENYTVVTTGSEQVLFLPFYKSQNSEGKNYDTDVVAIQLMLVDGETCTITLSSAELLSPDDPGVNTQIRRITTSTTEGYGTYCCDKNFQIPSGLTGYIITNVAKEKTNIYGDEEETNGGDDEEPGTGSSKARVKKLADEVDNGEGNNGDEDDPDEEEEEEHNEGYAITIQQKYEYPNIVPAGIGILVKGCGDSYDSPITFTAYVTNDNDEDWPDTDITYSPTTAKDNLLFGWDGDASSHQGVASSSTAQEMQTATTTAYNNLDTDETTYSAEDFYYYYLDYGKVTTSYDEYGNKSNTYSKLGFYWMNNDGSAFEMTSNRAWLPLLKSNFENGGGAGLKIIEYVEDDSEEQTTGITTVPTAAVETVSDGAIYTIQGVRVNNMNKPGVYIVDGKKVIKK